MSKNKKAETGDNVVMVGVCAAGLSFISWSLFYFIFFFLHSINPVDENVMKWVHFAQGFWLPCVCNWLFQGQGEI